MTETILLQFFYWNEENGSTTPPKQHRSCRRLLCNALQNSRPAV